MLRVEKVVGSLLSSNMYILFDESTTNCWIIDAGDYLSLAKTLPKDCIIKGVFLTHSHFDHIAGLNDLLADYPDCLVYTSEYGAVALYSAKKNMSYYHEKPFVLSGNNVIVLRDNDKVELFPNEYLNALATPGHCPSCLTFYTDKMVFTGDAYIPGVPIVTKLPRGNKVDAALSLEKILSLTKDRLICPGHDIERWESIL